MKKIRLVLPAFLASYLFFLLCPLLFPYTRLLTFAPFLIICMLRLEFAQVLWACLISGVIVDLYATSGPIGPTAIFYILTTIAIYRFRTHFTEEKVHILMLYPLLFSCTCSAMEILVLLPYVTGRAAHVFTILTDLFCMPLFDALFSLLFFFYPMKLYRLATRQSNLLLYRRWGHKAYIYLRKAIKTLRLSNAAK